VIVVDVRWRPCRGAGRFIHLMSSVWTSVWTSIWAIASMLDGVGLSSSLASSHISCESASRMCRTASREKRSRHVGTEYSMFRCLSRRRQASTHQWLYGLRMSQPLFSRRDCCTLGGVSQHFVQLMLNSVDTIECMQ
jgi:hypothetical protein